MEEKLLEAWVGITGIFKKTNIKKKLTYNESIVMLKVYKEYKKGIDKVSLKDICIYTNISKSLLNRTVKSLMKKGLLVYAESNGDSRLTYVSLEEKQLPKFLDVHYKSIDKAKKVIKLIGENSAKNVIESIEKIKKSKVFKEDF